MRWSPRQHAVHVHGPSNLTNLHYFHGGVVTPRNWGPPPTNNQPEGKNGPNLGNGDNIYVHLRQAETFDFYVPIPGRDRPLDGRVLEKGPATSDAGLKNPIEHPSGLNWYHSHLHGYSSHQVMGGMSGLLSVGEDLANVRAACLKDTNGRCTNSVDADTDALKKATDVRYVLLRDLRLNLTGLKKRPDEVNGDAADDRGGPGEPADWNHNPENFASNADCGAWDPAQAKLDMKTIALDTHVADRADRGASVECSETGDVDDAPASLCRHVRRQLADLAKIAHHLDVHVGKKSLIGDFGKRRWLALAAQCRVLPNGPR